MLLKLLKWSGLISKILPGLLKSWAEGGLGEPAKKLYWFLAGYKTITGAILMAVGTGLDALSSSYPEYVWAPQAARVAFWLGATLSSIGLVDGGTRSPWPAGTEIPAKEKTQ